MIQSRIKVSLDKYSDRYENVDLLLIEPDRGDEDLFFANVFSYSSRRRLVEHAYAAARAQIRARAEELEQLLAPYGLRLRHELLADANHKFADSLTEKGVYHAPAARQLERTLSELDEILESYQ
jgi:hypothetical protein